MRNDLLDPEILSRIDSYSLIARNVVEGFISGLHRSLYQGFGSEFVQYRSYVKGDDLKYVDWKVYARTGHLQMKVFQEETNTNCYIVLDCSNSMDYQGSKAALSKLRYAKMIAACLVYFVNRQGDNVGFFAYSNDIRCSVRPGHRTGQVHLIHNELQRLKASGNCDHQRTLNYLVESFDRRGIVVYISDLLDADERLFKALRYFRLSHHDCMVFQVLDDDELDFEFDSSTRFIDSENADELITSPQVVRHQYLKAMGEFLEQVKHVCVRENIDFKQVRTTDTLSGVMAAYLHRRELFR